MAKMLVVNLAQSWAEPKVGSMACYWVAKLADSLVILRVVWSAR